MSCLLIALVMGYKRVPEPPASMMPFIWRRIEVECKIKVEAEIKVEIKVEAEIKV